MKKGLLLLCFVGATVGLFAGEESAKTQDVNVTAEVIKPLNIETKAVEFGKVAQGTNHSKPKTEGELTITGEAGQSIKVQFAGNGEQWKDEISEAVVKLKQNSNGVELTYTPALATTLDTNLPGGKTSSKIVGSLEVPQNAETGSYRGTLKVKVYYN